MRLDASNTGDAADSPLEHHGVVSGRDVAMQQGDVTFDHHVDVRKVEDPLQRSDR